MASMVFITLATVLVLTHGYEHVSDPPLTSQMVPINIFSLSHGPEHVPLPRPDPKDVEASMVAGHGDAAPGVTEEKGWFAGRQLANPTPLPPCSSFTRRC
ncbi:hypothetical protein BRADI_5g23936v3 [Brachypodium distachyon]|uniref:Dirigent protein n=1 Tax=Brachypodium distachyon TaxID=15368 RepID=A0A0Q3EAT9_BRADI|nr:hypothetical protein BRADI_5g23936v3 [Brachypodium distachyon]